MLFILLALAARAQYVPDVLGDGYARRTFRMADDKEGKVVCTLVRKARADSVRQAVLYLHGYNDYFFQKELGDSLNAYGYNFYALDLRKYGRSMRPHQDPFFCESLSEYFADVDTALATIRAEGNERVFLMAHSTGGLIASYYLGQPGKGTALYRCRMKNLINGSGMEKTYRPTDKIEKPDLEEREMYYSYFDGHHYIFSDPNTYEEMAVSAETLGNQVYFLIEESLCNFLLFNGEPIEITLPTFIEKEIVDTEPGVRGDTATNVTKPAKIDNGYEIQVPLFINQGDIVKIDTRTGAYAERVSKA